MFGHQDHDEHSQDNPAPTPVEPTDDGTLGVPAPDDDGASTSSMPLPPAGSMTPAQTPPQTLTPTSGPMASTSTPGDLLSIKQEALQQLKPLIGHLEQSPEEKFRTTMMMIQAADDQSLLGDAYEAAKGIQDEKTRAQALLDVVNEINYFTAQKD